MVEPRFLSQLQTPNVSHDLSVKLQAIPCKLQGLSSSKAPIISENSKIPGRHLKLFRLPFKAKHKRGADSSKTYCTRFLMRSTPAGTSAKHPSPRAPKRSRLTRHTSGGLFGDGQKDPVAHVQGKIPGNRKGFWIEGRCCFFVSRLQCP